MADSSARAVFDRVNADPVNKKCFECGAPSPQWASVNNGIMICLNCSGQHRGLGVQASIVRSVSLDMWTEKQLKQLEQGGNQKLFDFFKQYNLHELNNIKIRYQTKAADYYRRRNAALATGAAFGEPEPSFEDGRTLLNGNLLDENNQIVQEPMEFDKSNQMEEEVKEESKQNREEEPFNPDAEMLLTQEAIMNSVKGGIGAMMSGLKTVKEKTVQVVPKNSDEAKESLEYSKQIAIQTAEKAKDVTKEGLFYAAEKTKQAAAVTSEYAGAAWNPVKAKLDETGATEMAKTSYNTAAVTAKAGLFVVN